MTKILYGNSDSRMQKNGFKKHLPAFLNGKIVSDQISKFFLACENDRDKISNKLRTILNSFDSYLLRNALQNNIHKLSFKLMETHAKKLRNLTRQDNSFPSSVIENVARKFLNNYFTPDSSQSVARKDNCLYFKLPYIGPFSIITQRRIKKLVNTLCRDLEIKLSWEQPSLNSQVKHLNLSFSH